jgi:hypothetical protein
VSRTAVVFLSLLAALGLGLLLERWIVTDREAIERLLRDAAESARRGDWDAVRAALADDFEGEDPARVVERARALASRAPGAWSLSVEEVLVEGDEAAARVRVHLAGFRPGGGGLAAEGRLGLARTGSGWRVRSISTDDPRWRP